MHNNMNVNVSGPVQASSTYMTKVLKGNHSFASQVTEPNMKYVIKHNFDLGGESVEIPEGCLLEFDGGAISNGTLVGQSTILIYNQPLNDILTATLEGTWRHESGVKADEEDITDLNGELKFKDKAYAPANYSGMGRVYLRKNIVDGVNTLTQNMMQASNTIYVIQYDFTLGEDITIPENCILEFDGGSVSGVHTVTGANTSIDAGLVKIFNTDVTLDGSWEITEIYSEWFGAKADNNTDCSDAMQKAFLFSYYTAAHVQLLEGKYIVSKPIILYGDNKISDYSDATYNLATRVKGCGKKRTFVIKNTNTTSGLNDHDVDAIFIIAGSIYMDGTYSSPTDIISDPNCTARGIRIEELTIWGKGSSYSDYSNYCAYGIYGLSLYHSEIKEINIFRCTNGIGFRGWCCYDFFTSIQVNFANVAFNFGIQYAAQTTVIMTQCHGNGIREKVFYLRGGVTLIDCIQDGGLATFLYCDRVIFQGSDTVRTAHVNCLRVHYESRDGSLIYSEGAMITIDDMSALLPDPQYTKPYIKATKGSNIIIRRITGSCADKSYKSYKFADVDTSSYLTMEDGYITNAWFSNYTKIYGRGIKEIINPNTECTYFHEYKLPVTPEQDLPIPTYTRANNELQIVVAQEGAAYSSICFFELKNAVDLTDVQLVKITMTVSWVNVSTNPPIDLHAYSQSYEDGYYQNNNVEIPHDTLPVDYTVSEYRGNLVKQTIIFNAKNVVGEKYLGLHCRADYRPTVTIFDGYLIY